MSEWNKGITLPPYKDIKDLHFEGAINTAMSIQNLKGDVIIKERFIYPNKDELKNGKKIPPYNDKSAY